MIPPCGQRERNKKENETTGDRKTTHHALRPLVHDLDEPEFECAELLAGDLVRILHALDAV